MPRSPSSSALVRLRLGSTADLAGGGKLVAHHVAAGLLERAIERRLEEIRIGEIVDVGPPDDPEVDALLAASVHLPGVVDRERRVRRHDRSAVAHRVAILLAAEDFPWLEHARRRV